MSETLLASVLSIAAGCGGGEATEARSRAEALSEESAVEPSPSAEDESVPAEVRDGTMPLTDGTEASMEARIRSECDAPELEPLDRGRCRADMFRLIQAELAAVDPVLTAARRRGATDAELTPLYDERYSLLRQRLVYDAITDEERLELADVAARLPDGPREAGPDDELADENALSPEVRAELELRMDTTRELTRDDERRALAMEVGR